MSVKTQNSLRAATKCVTTSPGASCAAVRRASTHTTTSTASVSITAQGTGHRSEVSHALSSAGVKCAGLFASGLPDEFELFQEFWDFPVKEKHDSPVRSVFTRKPHRRAECGTIHRKSLKCSLRNSVFKVVNHQTPFRFSTNNEPASLSTGPTMPSVCDCVVCVAAHTSTGFVRIINSEITTVEVWE